MSSTMNLHLLANYVLRLYSIFQPPLDGLIVMLKFILYPLFLCFKLNPPFCAGHQCGYETGDLAKLHVSNE